MTQLAAFRVGVSGILSGALALGACLCSALLPYRLSHTQEQLYGLGIWIQLIGLGLAIALGVVAQWGDVRSCRLGYAAIALGIVALAASGLSFRPHSVKHFSTERDEHAAASKLRFGSSEWHKKAAEDISVRIVAVLRKPADTLSWIDEREALQLTAKEKEAVATNGITGQLEVVYTTGGGGGTREVRVVIIQSSPLSSNTTLAVPQSGSFIYIQDGGALKPLLTNSMVSSLTLEIYQEKTETAFFMDYPRDRTRYGGAVFWWDANGKWHML